jgi:GT2 family glycosyltransferase
MMSETVSVIVPVWNGRELLERLFASLRRQTYPITEIVVVDNGSSDGVAEWAEQAGARVFRMGSNAGFARAVNRGIGESRGDWLALVNSDVEAEPEWLEKLLQAARDPDIWFVTGKILRASERNVIDGTYDALCRGGCAVRVGDGQPDGPLFSVSRTISFAPATAALYRAELFRRVGRLEESFESYLEDVEFGLRCACQGYTGRYVPAAIVYHVGSASLGKWHPETVRRTSRNQVFLVAKYYRGMALVRLGWPVLVAQGLWARIAWQGGLFRPYLTGKAQGLKNFARVRRQGPPVEVEKLETVLRESEEDLLRVLLQIGFGWYWRWYFLLTAIRSVGFANLWSLAKKRYSSRREAS